MLNGTFNPHRYQFIKVGCDSLGDAPVLHFNVCRTNWDCWIEKLSLEEVEKHIHAWLKACEEHPGEAIANRIGYSNHYQFVLGSVEALKILRH